MAHVVCDHEYNVLSITAGWPGRVHDDRVFTNSSICEKGHDGTLFPQAQAYGRDGCASHAAC